MPRRASQRLTDKLVRDLPPPAKGAAITYDAEVAGFGARVTAAGARAFVLNYVVAGRERRLTIGQFPTWSATAARAEAQALRRKIDGGIDPMEERDARDAAIQAERAAPTVTDLFTRYAAEHLPRKAPRSAEDDRSMWLKIVLPRLGAMKVAAVRPTDIDALHAEVGRTRPVRANRVVEVVRKAFNLAIRWGWRTDNPASGAHRNPEEQRARYLSADEILRLSEALAAHPEAISANAIRLLMLTGARRGEVLGATWDMFNLEAGIWIKPSSHTKQRKEHRAPLSAPAIQLLVTLRAAAIERARAEGREPYPYVFPGRDGRPLTDVKRTWRAVCKAAGLTQPVAPAAAEGETATEWRPTARLHDLRHTFASILASDGLSLPIIGALLGHTQVQTTSRYAHLLDDPLRAAVERVGVVVGTSPTHGASVRDASTDKPAVATPIRKTVEAR